MIPNIACLCPTYGRPPELLGEAVESFNRQTYPMDRRRLYVLNDRPDQTIRCRAPGVIVMNISERMTIGAKYNLMLDACTTWADLIVPWEDDDIYLPWALVYREHAIGDEPTWHTPRAWWLRGEDDVTTCTNLHHCNLIATVDAMTAVGGYDETDRPDLDVDLFTRLGARDRSYDIDPRAAWYIYRWGTTGSYHGSGIPPGETPAHWAECVVSANIKAGNLPSGEYEIKPQWTRDWTAFVAEHGVTQ